MRVKFGIVGLFGFGLSVTVAMADGSGQRGARLLPPRPADEAEVPIYARAAAEALPAIPESTPVRSANEKSANPAWLNGGDPNIRPAAGTSPLNSQPRPLISSGGIPQNDPSLVTRGFDKLKNTFSNEKTQPVGQQQPKTGTGTAPKTPANASTPFRGTAANGQPVYAGPPAYRWYGWGSVTPGANPYAPTGIPPKASANWYTITGATPGAFPVTVAEPTRQQGTEPPVYVPMPTARTAPGATHAPVVYVRQPANHAPPAEMQAPGVPVPELTRPPLPTESKFSPIPTLSPIPSVGAAPIAPQPLQTVSPSSSVTPALGTPLPVLPAADSESSSRIASPNPVIPVPSLPGESTIEVPPRPTLPVLPPVGTPIAPAMPVLPEMKPTATPAPLPMSVTEEPKWQPNTNPTSGKDWNPAGNKPQVFPETNLQQRGPDGARGLVARAQIADEQPNPISMAISTVCAGRATGLEIRWTGTKKLAVSFQCRAADAQKLVNEISGRPELAPYQIDFTVIAK